MSDGTDVSWDTTPTLQGTMDVNGQTLDNIGIIISNAADPADTGFIRMGNQETISWEAATPGVDISMQVDSNDNFNFS